MVSAYTPRPPSPQTRSFSPPSHRKAPSPPSPATPVPLDGLTTAAALGSTHTEEIMRSVNTLASLTAEFDEVVKPATHRSAPSAPPSSRRLVYLGSPHLGKHSPVAAAAKRNYAVRPASATAGHRPPREMDMHAVRLPYSQPWHNPQLDDTMNDLVKTRRQVGQLQEALKSVVKERTTAVATGKRASEIVTQKVVQIKDLERKLDEAEKEASAARTAEIRARFEHEALVEENDLMRKQVRALAGEIEDLKASNANFAAERVKAEQAAADSSVATAAAKAEARIAKRDAEEARRGYHEERKLVEAARDAEERREKQQAIETAYIEAERRARLEACVIQVRPDTRKAIDGQVNNLMRMTSDVRASHSAKYTQPASVWEVLDTASFAGQFDAQIVLLSAAWLRTSRPRRLPERQRLPPEAIIPLRSLKAIHTSIEKGMAKGGLSKPLPIISILLPKCSLSASGSEHPDPEGAYLEMIVNALDHRWAEFVTRRGTTTSTGVTDIGVFIDWSGMYQAPIEPGAVKSRSPLSAHEQRVFERGIKSVHLLYAHELTTVWTIPSGVHAAGPKELRYNSAWPSYLYLLSTVLKPNTLSELSAWPQLLDLGGHESANGAAHGHFDMEKVYRPAPPEPLVFHKGHKYGSTVNSEAVAEHFAPNLERMLAGIEQLDFRRCGWGDEEASWLAVVLPLCGNLKRLLLTGNQIGNAGATAIAGALSSGGLRSLQALSLDSNAIGDAGATALFGALSTAAAAELAVINLNNNEVADAAVVALSGAAAGGALRKGIKVSVEANPASKTSRKGLKKALKKASKRG